MMTKMKSNLASLIKSNKICANHLEVELQVCLFCLVRCVSVLLQIFSEGDCACAIVPTCQKHTALYGLSLCHISNQFTCFLSFNFTRHNNYVQVLTFMLKLSVLTFPIRFCPSDKQDESGLPRRQERNLKERDFKQLFCIQFHLAMGLTPMCRTPIQKC